MGGSAKKKVDEAKQYVSDRTGYSGSDAEKAANAASQTISDVGKTAEKASKKAVANASNIASNAIEAAKKSASGALEDIKRGASGTIKGAEETFKRSDIGKKAAEFQQYVMDRAGVKDPRDQIQQALDSTTEAVRNKVKQQKPKQGPGGGQTIGQGGVEGLKGGGSLAASQRSRIRQNKRKLRIARA